jgi:hypothetical protein
MSAAAAALTETIRHSGVRRVAFLGLAKNVGKTTALVGVLEELHRIGVAAGTTSAGRDGEDFDAITGEPKPRFRLWPGQFIASAASTYESASFPTTEVATLPFSTRFGPIQLRRADGEGEMEIIGPGTASQMARTAAALEVSGAETLLLDGAVGRRAFACARVADGVVLSVGMAAGGSLDSVVAAARGAVDLIRLGIPDPGARERSVEGALSGALLRDAPPRRGETLVAEDFTCIFLSPDERRRLAEQGATLAVRRPARLLAVTVNPTAPGRPPLPAGAFFASIQRAFPGVPVFDLVADLESGAAGNS